MIRRPLSADADSICRPCGTPGSRDAACCLTAGSRSSKASATRPESRSSASVIWVRSFEPIEKPSKCSRNCVGEQRVRGDLAHHDDRASRSRRASGRSPPAARSRCFASSTVRTNGTMISTLVSPMSSRTFFKRPAFELEAVAERRSNVARRPAETEHRVLFARLVALAAGQARILVRLEVREPHDHRLRPERRAERRHALGELLDVERHRVRRSRRYAPRPPPCRSRGKVRIGQHRPAGARRSCAR